MLHKSQNNCENWVYKSIIYISMQIESSYKPIIWPKMYKMPQYRIASALAS